MRSRTGCLTCRQRKLKCDEGTPTCEQCTKSNRACVAAEAVPFRHEQNASLNSQNNPGPFYADTPSFGANTVWVGIPRTLQFIHTTNPYDEAATSIDPPSTVPSTTTTTAPQHLAGPFLPPALPATTVAAHGLDALSTAATSHHDVVSSASPYMSQYPPALPPPPPPYHHHHQHPPPPHHPSSSAPSSDSNVNTLLNPTIDPNLQRPWPTPRADAANQALADLLTGFKGASG